jgi:23S rRNA pseudouridine1911/1915/1917 synthase
VGVTWTVDDAEAGIRLDKFLAEARRLGSRGRAQTALARGTVFVNGNEAAAGDAARRLIAGDVVRLWMDRPGSSRVRTPRAARAGELPIVYEDDALVVVNKPPGLLSVPLPDQPDAPSVQDALVGHLRSRGKRRPLAVHRIDRDTSGLVVFATRPAMQARLKEQFRRREPERVYLAIVYGRPSPAEGTWRDYLAWDQDALIQKKTDARDPRAQEAVSRYRVVEEFDGCSLVEVRLVTGRRNQIRLQARLRGHTLVGETRYTFGPEDLRPIRFERQALHAHRLSFQHPETARKVSFEAPLPDDMKSLLDGRILFRTRLV